jgi:hypothetical protein
MKTAALKDSISRDVAEKELETWFDAKKLDQDERENINPNTEKDDNKELLIRGFMNGHLVLNPDTFIITQTLKFPPVNGSGEVVFKTLEYKYRLNQKEVKGKSIGLKQSDIRGTISAYIAALTGQERNIIDLLDTQDRKVADAIVTYFL